GSRRDLEVAPQEHLRDELRDAQADKTWPDSPFWVPGGGIHRISDKEVRETLDTIESTLEGNPGIEVLAALLKEMSRRPERANACTALGEDVQHRFEALRERVEAAYVDALGLRARAEIVSAREGAELATWATYEDVVRRLKEDANDAKDRDKIKIYGDAAKE